MQRSTRIQVKINLGFSFIIALLISFFYCQSALADTAASTANFTPAQQQELQTMMHDYILNHPEVIIQAAQKYQQNQEATSQQQIKQAVADNAQQLLNSKISPVAGNINSPISVIEFFDYQCVHCKNMAPVVKQLMQQNPNIKFIFKEFPIFGEASELSARVALAAAAQGKFLAMHDALMSADSPFTDQQIMALAKSLNLNMNQISSAVNSADISQEVNTNLSIAHNIGIQGTPTFIVINSSMDSNHKITINDMGFIAGEIEQSQFQNIINQVEKNQKLN